MKYRIILLTLLLISLLNVSAYAGTDKRGAHDLVVQNSGSDENIQRYKREAVGDRNIYLVGDGGKGSEGKWIEDEDGNDIFGGFENMWVMDAESGLFGADLSHTYAVVHCDENNNCNIILNNCNYPFCIKFRDRAVIAVANSESAVQDPRNTDDFSYFNSVGGPINLYEYLSVFNIDPTEGVFYDAFGTQEYIPFAEERKIEPVKLFLAALAVFAAIAVFGVSVLHIFGEKNKKAE